MSFKKNMKKAFENWAIEYVKVCDMNGNAKHLF